MADKNIIMFLYCRLYVILCFMSLRIASYGESIGQPQSTDVHLEAPNLSAANSFKQPLRHSSLISIEPDVRTDAILTENQIDPCDGTYIKTNGTTCGLEQIIVGRCYDYQYIKRGLYLSNVNQIINCTQLYALFEAAARDKPYCSQNMSTYEKYFEYGFSNIQVVNRAMFWTGTYAITHAYSNQGYNYVTLEDSLAAYVVNGLTWCGKENDTEGFDYVSCPNRCTDNIWADQAFWGLASRKFASKAAGEIFLVLNGSRTDGQPSFRNNSYFAVHELPNLQRTGPNRVTKLNVLLLHSPDQTITEKCGEKSLIVLESIVRSYGIEYVCKDDPDELILIMCGDAWEARECQSARQILKKEWNIKLYGQAANINYQSVFAVFSFSFIINYIL